MTSDQDKTISLEELRERWPGQMYEGQIEDEIREGWLRAYVGDEKVEIEVGSNGKRLFRVPGKEGPQEVLPNETTFRLKNVEHIEQQSPELVTPDTDPDASEPWAMAAVFQEGPDWSDWKSGQDSISLDEACCYALNLYFQPTLRHRQWSEQQIRDFGLLRQRAIRAGFSIGQEHQEVDKKEFARWALEHSHVCVPDELIAILDEQKAPQAQWYADFLHREVAQGLNARLNHFNIIELWACGLGGQEKRDQLTKEIVDAVHREEIPATVRYRSPGSPGGYKEIPPKDYPMIDQNGPRYGRAYVIYEFHRNDFRKWLQARGEWPLADDCLLAKWWELPSKPKPPVAKKEDPTPEERAEVARQGATDKKKAREKDLISFANKLYENGKKAGVGWAANREPLPFPKDDFMAVFWARHRGHKRIETGSIRFSELGIKFGGGAPDKNIDNKARIQRLIDKYG